MSVRCHPRSITPNLFPSAALVALAVSLVAACDDASTAGLQGDAAALGEGGGGVTLDGAAGGGGGGGGGDGGSGNAGGGEGGTTRDGGASASAEVCDGVDNDGDGIIDNVDEGNDGICDCLNIGIIGRIGPWSNGGNIFRDWLNGRSPRPAQELGDQRLTDALLAPLDVIVVLRADTKQLDRDGSPAHHAFSADEVAALERWVRGGGGLLTTIGYQGDEASEVQNVNRLLAPLGMRYQSESTFLRLDGDITDWATHPIAEGVNRVRAVNGVEPAPEGGAVVARDHQGRVALVAGTPDDGHVIVFGDEWITYDSEWQDVATLQIERLWLNMLKWMSPPERCQVDIPII